MFVKLYKSQKQIKSEVIFLYASGRHFCGAKTFESRIVSVGHGIYKLQKTNKRQFDTLDQQNCKIMGTIKKIADTIITIKNSQAFKQTTATAGKLVNQAFIETKKLTVKAFQSAKEAAIQKRILVKPNSAKPVTVDPSPLVKTFSMQDRGKLGSSLAKDNKINVQTPKDNAPLKEKKENDLLQTVRELKKM